MPSRGKNFKSKLQFRVKKGSLPWIFAKIHPVQKIEIRSTVQDFNKKHILTE